MSLRLLPMLLLLLMPHCGKCTMGPSATRASRDEIYRDLSQSDAYAAGDDDDLFVSESIVRQRASMLYKEKSGRRLQHKERGVGLVRTVFSYLPEINFRYDPVINFKFKQRLVLLGAAVTLGLDYLSDISQWRSYCNVEDTVFKGRFSLRGSELGWAKSWLLNLGLGEEQTAKFKLRLGLNLNSYKAYAKLRFRTEPISPFDMSDGVSCAGKLPLPVQVLPMLHSVPLRIEYKVRINTARPVANRAIAAGRSSGSRQVITPSTGKKQARKVMLSTGLSTVDVSLEQLNFCLEWDEHSPVWDIGLVKPQHVGGK